METSLIVFEGVDNSGKTTVSKELVRYLPAFFRWSKEPVFSTEEADRLNSTEFKGNDAKREVFFLESRLRQQPFYRGFDVVLDRYLWTGIAYAKVFSPGVYGFCEELYSDFSIFKKPDIVFFMDTPLATCYDREPTLKAESGRLEAIRQAYADTEKFVDVPVVYLDGSKDVDACVQECLSAIAEVPQIRTRVCSEY